MILAAKAVHAALVRLHSHISGHDKHVLGVAYQPRHDPGGNRTGLHEILSDKAHAAAVRNIAVVGNDADALIERLPDGQIDLGRILRADDQPVHAVLYLLPDRADKLLTRHRAQRHLEQLKRIVRDIAQRPADAADDLPVEIGIRPLRNQNGGAVPRRGRGLFAAVSQLFRCTEHFFAHDCIDVRPAVQDTVHRAARYARKLRHLLHCYCHLLTLLPSIRRQNRLALSSLRRCKSLPRPNRNHYTRKCFFRQESPCTAHNHVFASAPSVPSHSAQNQSHFLGRITMLRSGY